MVNSSEKIQKVLDACNVVKIYPGTVALKGVNFSLKKGEVRGLLGKNGAGKSTLIGILAGLTRKTKGDIYYFGQKVECKSVEESEAMGFRFVAQEFSLMEDLSVAENIVFREHNIYKGFKFINLKSIQEIAEKKLSILGLDIDPNIEVCFLKPAERQMVLLVREIFSTGSKIVALDEATTALSIEEKEKVYGIIRKQKMNGQSFIYVSHEIDEVFEICDYVTVIRDGLVILDEEIKNVTHDDLKRAIAGRETRTMFYRKIDKEDSVDEILVVKKLTNFKLKGIDFRLRKGEILGVYGFRGSGRTELLKTIYGLLKRDDGSISFRGLQIGGMTPAQLIQKGISFIPENRSEGLFYGRSTKENLLMSAITSTGKLRNWIRFFISLAKENKMYEYVAKKLQIKAQSPEAEIDYISGGNKQKVMFGRSLVSDSEVILVDEGTKGIDIGAKSELYRIMRSLVQQGCSILFTSSDLEEVCNLSDRVMVMREGRIIRIISGNEVTKEKLLHYADGFTD